MDGKVAELFKRPGVRVASVAVLLGGYAVSVWLATFFSEFAGRTVFALPWLLLAFAVFSFGPCLVLTVLVSHFLELRGLKWIAAIALAACIAPYLYPWHPRMQFISRFDAIEVGTSRAELMWRMKPYLRVRESNEGHLTKLNFYWNDDAYDADWAWFYLQDGRVVSKKFLPD